MKLSAQGETIVAVSSPPGRGAISLVRMSGPASTKIIEAVFRAKGRGDYLSASTPTVGQLFNGTKEPLDEVVMTCFRAPRSFTGEDVVEISCHGSPVVTHAILQSLIARGARLAKPGEFTLRAFFHGKLDLSQAEGIRDMVAAQTRRQAERARRQMAGALSVRLSPWKERLIDIVVQLETAVEFVEEPVTPRDRDTIIEEMRQLTLDLNRMSQSFETGRLLREGWMVAISGRPNVGKSSIFNRLLADQRAIVTDVPGTTRDALHEAIELEGVPVTLVDTAGLRAARGRVEQEGVRRSRESVTDAHMVLFVLDAARKWTAGDTKIWKELNGKRVLVVWNKIDLLPEGVKLPKVEHGLGAHECWSSAKTGEGLDELKRAIVNRVLPRDSLEDDLLITDARHKDCLERTQTALRSAQEALAKGLSEEFAVADLRRALNNLGEITGETLVEDLLDRIFSQFCIGK